MRITEAAQRLGISPRMLRYRESLGLLPVVRGHQVGRLAGRARPSPAAPSHRQFGAADLDAVALGLAIEQRYDISPTALAFGLRVLADPATRAQVAELGRRIGRIRPLPAMAMDFEKERALRLLSPGKALSWRAPAIAHVPQGGLASAGHEPAAPYVLAPVYPEEPLDKARPSARKPGGQTSGAAGCWPSRERTRSVSGWLSPSRIASARAQASRASR